MDLDSKELYPLLVPKVQDQPDTPEVRESIWTKARSLSQENQDLLLSDELKVFILEQVQSSTLSEADVEHFSRLIRTYFFKEDSVANITAGIGALFHRDAAFGHSIMASIENLKTSPDEDDELAIDPAYESPVAPTELLTLESAYDKFPQVLKQLVTTDKIITKPFLNPLSPTVRNWIAVYEKISGVKKHTSIERGDFLYRSQACKALTDKDRNKLAQLLGARDEETELTFDSEMGGILWENKAVITEQKDVSPAPETVLEAQDVSTPTIDLSTPVVSPVPQTGILKSAPKVAQKPTLSTGGVTGKDGTFSPQVGRRKHGEVNINGDPQIVTRPRMALGAAGHKADTIASNSGAVETPVVEKPIQFVGSARNNAPETSAADTKPPVQEYSSSPTPEQEPTLKSFAQVSTRADAVGKDTAIEVDQDDFKINFSSGQTLPAEKAKVTTEEEPPIKAPQSETPPVPKRSPFHIDPMGGR